MDKFLAFVNEESDRQQRAGLEGLPSDNEAAAVWKAEAFRHWSHSNILDSKVATSENAEARELEARSKGQLSESAAKVLKASQVAEAAKLNASKIAQFRSGFASTSGPRNADSQVQVTLQSFEFTLRLFFHDSTNQSLNKIIIAMRDPIAKLREEGVLGYGPRSCAIVNILYELFCYRRLRKHWGDLPSEVRAEADAGAQQLCDFFPHNTQFQGLKNAIAGGKSTTEKLNVLIDAAGRAPRLDFEQLWKRIARLHPKAIRPDAEPTLEEDASPLGDAAEPLDVDAASEATTADGDPQERPPTPANGRAPGQMTLGAPTTSLAAVATRRQPPPAQFVSPGARQVVQPGQEQSIEESVGEMLFEAASPPKAKKRTEDIINPRHTAANPPRVIRVGNQAVPIARAAAQPARVAAGASPVAAVLGGASPLNTPRAQATTTGASPGTAVVNSRLSAARYPCQSKYHATYSSPEKHGSAECPYCAVCHMMEFLFNGCARDCRWNHFPTQKKISLHLKRFPAVYMLALRRLQDLQVKGRLDPIDIELSAK